MTTDSALIMPLSTREGSGNVSGNECGFEGNFETYGLGVRLGIYLSWLSIIIAAAWFPKIIAELTDGLIIFLVAFLAATILVSVQRDQIYTVEIIIMTYLYFGGIVTCSMSILAAGIRKPSEKHPVSLWRGTIMCITAIAMGIYCFWFYWGAEPFLDTPCGTWIFPFGNIQTASFRRSPVLIYAILSAIVGVSWPFTAVTALVLFSPDMVTILAKVFSKNFVNPRPHRTWYEKLVANIGKEAKVRFLKTRQSTRRKSDKSKRISRHIVLAISVLTFVWSITGVELMLKKNSVTKVNALATTGQLIPFIIGVATVTRLAYNAISEDYKPPQLIWGFFFYDEQKVFDGQEGENLDLIEIL